MSSVERDRAVRRERERRGRGEAEHETVRDRERLDTSTSGYGSELGYSSPVHSSEFSLRSSHSGDTDRSGMSCTQLSVTFSFSPFRLETLSTVSLQSQEEARVEISEEMIEFVKSNPRVMRRWQSLAHAAGLSHRVEVIKARIRSEGRDLDEHVEEFLREWMEYRPEQATLAGLSPAIEHSLRILF